MAEKYAVVRTDNMTGSDVRSQLVSVKHMGADGNTPTAIENGNVLALAGLMSGEREIFVGEVPAADADLNTIVLVASPEVLYDERDRNLSDFINEAGKPARGYRLHSGDIFSVTEKALSGTPTVGGNVTLDAATKLAAGGSGTAVGTIIGKEVAGPLTFFVIEVA